MQNDNFAAWGFLNNLLQPRPFSTLLRTQQLAKTFPYLEQHYKTMHLQANDGLGKCRITSLCHPVVRLGQEFVLLIRVEMCRLASSKVLAKEKLDLLVLLHWLHAGCHLLYCL